MAGLQRKGAWLGKTIQIVPPVTRWIERAAKTPRARLIRARHARRAKYEADADDGTLAAWAGPLARSHTLRLHMWGC